MLSNLNNNVIVSIDGNIGSGKSTLLNKLKKHYENEKKIIFLKEPVDEWEKIKDKNNETIIEKFYENKKKYSFSFQMLAYISRYKILKEALENNNNCILITERSIFTDKMVFAKMLYERGDMEEINYKIYLQWFNFLSEKINVNKLIYIDTKTDICIKRISKRNREGENKIELEYLKKCEDYHKSMINKLNNYCMCENQLIIDGNIDNSMNKNYYFETIQLIDEFIHK